MATERHPRVEGDRIPDRRGHCWAVVACLVGTCVVVGAYLLWPRPGKPSAPPGPGPEARLRWSGNLYEDQTGNMYGSIHAVKFTPEMCPKRIHNIVFVVKGIQSYELLEMLGTPDNVVDFGKSYTFDYYIGPSCYCFQFIQEGENRDRLDDIYLAEDY